MSTYDGNTGLIANYINPLIGDVPMQQVNTRFVGQFNRTLEKRKPVINRNRKPKDELSFKRQADFPISKNEKILANIKKQFVSN